MKKFTTILLVFLNANLKETLTISGINFLSYETSQQFTSRTRTQLSSRKQTHEPIRYGKHYQ